MTDIAKPVAVTTQKISDKRSIESAKFPTPQFAHKQL